MNVTRSSDSGISQSSNPIGAVTKVMGKVLLCFCTSLVLVCSLSRDRNKSLSWLWRQMVRGGGGWMLPSPPWSWLHHHANFILHFDRKTKKVHDTRIYFPLRSILNMLVLASSFKVIFSPYLWHGWLPTRYKKDPSASLLLLTHKAPILGWAYIRAPPFASPPSLHADISSNYT